MKVPCLAVALTLFTLAAGHIQAAPLETYGRLPTIEDAEISPDGQKLGMIWTDGAQRRVIIRELATGKLDQLSAGAAKVRSLDWAGSNHLLITMSTTTAISEINAPRSEYFLLLDYDLTRGKVRPLMNDASNSLNVIAGPPRVRQVKDKTVVLVEGIHFDHDKGVDSLFQIDLESGKSKLVQEGFDGAEDWVVGLDGEPLAQATYDQKTGLWILWVRQAGAWRIFKSSVVPQGRPALEGLGRTPGAFLVAEPVEDAIVLHEIAASDTGWGEPLRKDLTGAVLHMGGGGPLLGFHDLIGEDDAYEFLAPTDTQAWAKIRRAYKGARVQLVSWSADRDRIVVQVDRGNDSPSYALVDLKAGRADSIGFQYEALRPADVSQVRPISFKAADGLQITGYLTLPNGRSPQKLPLIVLPHGGPASRDEPGFDWWSQALASRGYAVLRVNFRGSDGFGAPFMAAGYGQWGRKMQTDLSDGVRYLAADGTIDPARVCIAGASYGGYAALAGAAFDSKVYRCAASISGPSDLAALVGRAKNVQGLAAMRYWTRFIGADDGKDPVLKALSPANHADQIQVPILLIHGKDDTVVPIWQSQNMERALKAAGKDVQMVTLPGEDHWLSRGETRQQMLTSLVAFLEKNNPPQ